MVSLLSSFNMRTLYTREINGGIQHVYKFANGYGASVVQHEFSYGSHENLWELAVIHFDDTGEWSLDFSTAITDDVIGWINMVQVMEILLQIEHLQPKVLEVV